MTDLILDKKVYEKSSVGIKDILITNNKIYLSYSNNTDECYNTSILRADINLNFLEFEKFFEPNNCANKESGEYIFNPHSSGGKMVLYNEDNIIFIMGRLLLLAAPQC